MGGPRTDFLFPRVIEEQLLKGGRPCDVRAHSMPADTSNLLSTDWMPEIATYSPDVIVMTYGHTETVHLFLPRWLERHVDPWNARPIGVGVAYRKYLLRPFWRLLARLQQKLDRIVPPNIRRRERTVVADIEHYFKNTQKIASPHVILMDIVPPASFYNKWFPGMAARIDTMNAALEDMVARIASPNLELFSVRRLVDEQFGGDPEIATPDGGHYTPEAHRALGVALAERIEEWAATQPHLALAGELAESLR
jgi:lysophospholipase L1-like esterase